MPTIGTEELDTIIRDNNLPAVIEETGQTWVRVRLTDPQTGLSETKGMGLSDFADLILHWRAHGCHKHPCSAMVASSSDAEHP